VIPKGDTHEFWRVIHAGALKAASETGAEISWMAPPQESDRDAQISLTQQAMAQQFDAIALAPLDSRSLVPVVKAATMRNIPVIIFDSELDSEDGLSFIATDNYDGGQRCARFLCQQLQPGDKVLLLRHLEGSASTTAREAGFLEGLQTWGPELTLLPANRYGGPTRETSFGVAQELLEKYERIDGIFCPNETSAESMLRALQATGRLEEVKGFVGFDASSALIDGLKNHEIDALAVQDPFQMGYQAVLQAVAAARGEPVTPHIDTRIALITPDNLQEPVHQELLYPPVEEWLPAPR